MDCLNFGYEETLLAPINRYLALSFFGSVSTFWWDEQLSAKIFLSLRSHPHLNAQKKKERKEQNIITQAAAIACNMKLPLKSILFYIQFLNPTSQSVLPPIGLWALEIIWPLTLDDERSRDRPCVTVARKHPRGMQGDTRWLSRPRTLSASLIAIKNRFGRWAGPSRKW